MSLVPTYVEATDGQFYKNPILAGPGWFVCFDDDEPPELVVMESHANAKHPAKVLDRLGLTWRPDGLSGHRSERCFTQRGPIKLRRAVGYFFRLEGPIPVPSIHDGVYDAPQGDCVVYAFKKKHALMRKHQGGTTPAGDAGEQDRSTSGKESQ